jgi:hypothetical protein
MGPASLWDTKRVIIIVARVINPRVIRLVYIRAGRMAKEVCSITSLD